MKPAHRQRTSSVAACVVHGGHSPPAGHLVVLVNPRREGEFGSFLIGLCRDRFRHGRSPCCQRSNGFELHDRTLTLLLSQPMQRTRLWNEKFLAAALSVVTLAIIHGWRVRLPAQLPAPSPETILYATFVCHGGLFRLALVRWQRARS